MKQILTVLLLAFTFTAFSQVAIPKKSGGNSVQAKSPSDTSFTVEIKSKISYDTTKVVVELLGDDGGEYLQPVYKRAYVIRKILTHAVAQQQPQIEWQKLYDEKWALISYGPSEAKAITPFEWKQKK